MGIGKAAVIEELWVGKTNGLCPPPPSSMLSADKGGGNRRTWVRKPRRGRKQRRSENSGAWQWPRFGQVVHGLKPTPFRGTVVLGRAQIGVQSVSNYSNFAQVL
jgi:hypothetical protein